MAGIYDSPGGQFGEATKVFYQSSGAQGCIAFINDWLWTYDPRTKPGWRPFVLFPKQEQYITWLWARYQTQTDGLVEKSRSSGATYLSVAFALYLWLFHEGSKIGFGSRKEILVDRSGDLDSIFEKIRLLLRRLPYFLLPPKFDLDKHCSYMRCLNPYNGNAITGEAGDNIGRGGRNTIYFKDESAFYEHAQKIDAALSENSNCKIDISTPNGSNNEFAKKRFSSAIPVFTFSWREDPRKSAAWYQERANTLPPHILAQEIDINYSASVDGLVIPAEWVEAAVGLDIGSARARVIAGYDPADVGADKHALVARCGAQVIACKEWSDTDVLAGAARAYTLCAGIEVGTIIFDSVGVGAGVRGEFSRLAKLKQSYAPRVVAYNAGGGPSPGFYAPSKSNKEMFLNLKSQLYWQLRDRFYRTWQVRTKGARYPPDQLISLPKNSRELQVQLSRPTWSCDRADGKIVIDKKPHGAASPNLADALVMSFYSQRTVAVA